MRTIDLQFGALVRTGLNMICEGKWDGDLFGWKKDSMPDAHLTTSFSSPISDDSASTLSSTMFHYSHFKGKGRDMLAKALETDDPFEMLPYEILERVLASGEPPQVDSRQAKLWRDIGQVYEVRIAKRNFLVAISRGTEEINVQEVRADAYPSVDFSQSARRPARRLRSATCKTKTPLAAASPVAV